MDPKERLTAICAAFPEATVEEHPPHAAEMAAESYRLVAPKRLSARLKPAP